MLRRWGVLVVFFLSVAACGGEDGEQAEATASTSTTIAAGGEAPAYFSSPTGNIVCEVDPDDGVRCDIGERDWTQPDPPGDCPPDWVIGLWVYGEHGAGFACYEDAVARGQVSEELPYGSSVERGTFTCQSEESGVTCLNSETGAGFMLSRSRYELLQE